MQDSFDQLYKGLTNEQKAEVFANLQSDAEVGLARFEDIAHDPVYEPDPDNLIDCRYHENPGECQAGSTNSNTRKKHREFRDIYDLIKTKEDRKNEAQSRVPKVINLIQDIPQDPNDPNSQSRKIYAENKMDAILSEVDSKKRKDLIKELNDNFLSKRGCCYENGEAQRGITKFIERAEMLDIEDNKEKARSHLESSKFLSDSDKESLQNLLNTENSAEEPDAKEKARKKAADRLKNVKEARNRRGYQFGQRLINGLKGSGIGQSETGQKPKHYTKSFTRTFRTSSTTSKINAFGNGVNTALQSIEKWKSGDALEIVSATMDAIAFISSFAGPYGAAFSSILGVANIFIGIFKTPGPTQIEVITNLINDQTETIVNKIDEQTEILIETMKALDEASTKSIITAIEQSSWREMIDEMRGATNSLKTKKIHLEEYRFSCILNWIEIALESDMQHITRAVGKVGSFMTWYCYSRRNIAFCGDMIFQYVLLVNVRNSVRGETINVVANSNIHNQHNKLSGLLAEYHTDLATDKELLKKVTKTSNEDDPDFHLLCFAACAFHKIGDKFVNDNIEGIPIMQLGPKQMALIFQYFAKVNYINPSNIKNLYTLTNNNTPGTAGGPGGRDRTLAVESRKNVRLKKKYSRDCGWPRRP